MTEIAVEKDVVLSCISEIVDLIQSQSTFQELDKHEMVQLLLTLLLKNWSLEQVMAIPDDEPTSLIESIMLFEIMAGDVK